MKEPAHSVIPTMMKTFADFLKLSGEKETASTLNNYHSFCALANVLCSMAIPKDTIEEVVANLKKIQPNWWISASKINEFIEKVRRQ